MEKQEDVAKNKRPRDFSDPREGATAVKPKRLRKVDGEYSDSEFVRRGAEGPGIGAPGIGASPANKPKGKGIKIEEESAIIPYNSKHRRDIPSGCKKRYDWRFRGLIVSEVTNIKREICWAPAAAHCIEAFHNYNFVKDLKLAERASVTELIHNVIFYSPADTINSIGRVFRWISENGLNRDEDYRRQPRRLAHPKIHKALKIEGYQVWPNDKRNTVDEVELFKVLKTTPVVGVIYYTEEFASYKYGEVYAMKTPCNEMTTMRHAVLIVGWSTTKDGIDFWLVRNCHGKDWGDKGYAMIARQSCTRRNVTVFLEIEGWRSVHGVVSPSKIAASIPLHESLPQNREYSPHI